MTFPSKDDPKVKAAWNAYVIAHAACEANPTIENGLKAGAAWSRWLSLFERKGGGE